MQPLKVSAVKQFFENVYSNRQGLSSTDVASFDHKGQLVVKKGSSGDWQANACQMSVSKLESNLRYLEQTANNATGGKSTPIMQRKVQDISGNKGLTIDALMEKFYDITESEMAEIHDLQMELTAAITSPPKQTEKHSDYSPEAEVSQLSRRLAEKAYDYFAIRGGDKPLPERLKLFLASVEDAVCADSGDPDGTSPLVKAMISSNRYTLEKVTAEYKQYMENMKVAHAEHEQQYPENAPSPSLSQDENLALGSLTSSLIQRARSQSVQAGEATVVSNPDVVTSKGKILLQKIQDAEKLTYRAGDEEGKKDFLFAMDEVFIDCQQHMTELCNRNHGKVPDHIEKECDALCKKLVGLRNHWGPNLLPDSVCNAFVRERMPVTLNGKQYRVDCAQFFEAIPFYENQSVNKGELMKLHRFTVFDANSKPVARYFLERSKVSQLYHVLSKVARSERVNVMPYGTKEPSYWDIREAMLNDLQKNGSVIPQQNTQTVSSATPKPVTPQPRPPKTKAAPTAQSVARAEARQQHTDRFKVLYNDWAVDSQAEYDELCLLMGAEYMLGNNAKFELQAFKQLKTFNKGFTSKDFQTLMFNMPKDQKIWWVNTLLASRKSTQPYNDMTEAVAYAVKICMPEDTNREIITAIEEKISQSDLSHPAILDQLKLLDGLCRTCGRDVFSAGEISFMLDENMLTRLQIERIEKTLGDQPKAESKVKALKTSIGSKKMLREGSWNGYGDLHNWLGRTYSLVIRQVPKNGDCFFAAIGRQVNEPMRVVRGKCHNTAVDLLDMKKGRFKRDPNTRYAKGLKAACQHFTKEQFDMLESKVKQETYLKPAYENAGDGNASWGENDDLPLVALTYGRPAVPIVEEANYRDVEGYLADGTRYIEYDRGGALDNARQSAPPLVLLKKGNHWDPLVPAPRR